MCKARIFDDIASIYFEKGEQGEHWEAVPPQEVQDQKELLLQGLSRITEQRLRAITRTWEEWQAWSKTGSESVSPYRPSATARHVPSQLPLQGPNRSFS